MQTSGLTHTLPIETEGMLYVPVHLNGRGPYTFNLDTGCLGLSCSLEVAREVGLPTEPSAPRVLQSLAIGSFRRADFPIGLYDTTHVSEIQGRRVDGYLGNLLFAFLRLAVTIDYPGRALTLVEAVTQAADTVETDQHVPDLFTGAEVCFRRPGEKASANLQIRLSNGYVILPVFLDEQGPFDFILDTGAAVCSVSPETADRLILPRGEKVAARGAVNDMEGFRSQVSRFRVGEAASENLPVLVHDHAYLSDYTGRRIEGHIGYPFLISYQVTLDYREATATPQEAP